MPGTTNFGGESERSGMVQCLRRTFTADGKVKEDRCKESPQEIKCCVYPALSCMEEQESIKYTKIRIFNTNVR